MKHILVAAVILLVVLTYLALCYRFSGWLDGNDDDFREP
jgi:hypothetical protein